MSHYQQVPEGKDPSLWQTAHKRASFKRHAITYVIVNAFLWITWYLSAGHKYQNDSEAWGLHHFPWPIWTTVGWGIGLAFHFASAYIFPETNSVEREYEKLKNKKQSS